MFYSHLFAFLNVRFLIFLPFLRFIVFVVVVGCIRSMSAISAAAKKSSSFCFLYFLTVCPVGVELLLYEEYFGTGKKKYETRGIHQEIPIEYRCLMWQMIEKINVPKDYLQIFRLRVTSNQSGDKIQNIIHTQEEPEYRREYTVPIIGKGVSGKVYIIDDGDYATMLWAEEY